MVKTPVGGGARTTLIASLDVALYGQHVDDTYVDFSYVPRTGGGSFTFARVPIAGGGAVETIFAAADGSARMDGIDHDAGFLYTRAYTGQITKWDRTSKTPTALPPTATLGQGFATTATDVFWAESVGDPSTGTGHVAKVAKTGGAVSDLGAIPRRPDALAVDGTNAYVAIGATKTDSGAIYAIALGGGTAKLLADGLDSPAYLVPSGGQLYFVDRTVTGGPIRSIPLP